MYVLIIITMFSMTGLVSGSDNHVVLQEFGNQQACTQAAEFIASSLSDKEVKVKCVPKEILGDTK